jgi:hypothetical protein
VNKRRKKREKRKNEEGLLRDAKESNIKSRVKEIR